MNLKRCLVLIVVLAMTGLQPTDPPMFTVTNSDASFTFGFYHWNSPFTTIVEETVGSETRMLPRKDLANYYLPLYRGCGAGRP